MTTLSATPITYGRDSAMAKFSVGRYQRMIEAGILTPDDRVELLENYVVHKMPRNPPHDGTIDLINAVLFRSLPVGWLLRIQQAIVLADSQPEPDFAIVRGTPRSFVARHPVPADIGVLVEVAEASLLRDQRDKTRIYARAGIPIYWIVNLVDRRIEVFAAPVTAATIPAYQTSIIYQPGDLIPVSLDGQVIAMLAVDDMLP